MAIDATVGGVNANSYNTLVAFDAYILARLHVPASVTASTGPQREFALMLSTTLFDIQIPWTGAPATTTQALAWPRTGMSNRNGVAISAAVLPAELQQASMEFALKLLVSDRTADNAAARQGISEVKAGDVGVKFRDDFQWSADTPPSVPDSVLLLLVKSWYAAAVADQAFMVNL